MCRLETFFLLEVILPTLVAGSSFGVHLAMRLSLSGLEIFLSSFMDLRKDSPKLRGMSAHHIEYAGSCAF